LGSLCVPKTSSGDDFSCGRFKPFSHNAWSKKARSAVNGMRGTS
jgi:hypothetical protein